MQHMHRLKQSREGRSIFVSRATQLKKRRALGTRLGGRATGNLLPRFSLRLVPWKLAKLVNGVLLIYLKVEMGTFCLTNSTKNTFYLTPAFRPTQRKLRMCSKTGQTQEKATARGHLSVPLSFFFFFSFSISAVAKIRCCVRLLIVA